jgi:hypothetical protein
MQKLTSIPDLEDPFNPVGIQRTPLESSVADVEISSSQPKWQQSRQHSHENLSLKDPDIDEDKTASKGIGKYIDVDSAAKGKRNTQAHTPEYQSPKNKYRSPTNSSLTFRKQSGKTSSRRRREKKLSLSQFVARASPARQARERLLTSPDPLREISKMLLTPDCVGGTEFRSRPCLVTSVRLVDGDLRCIIAPVTKFENKDLEGLPISDFQKQLFLPIVPNEWDVLGRAPIHTDPVWQRNNSYQMLVRMACSMHRPDGSRFTTYTCDESDFGRILEEIRNVPSLFTNAETEDSPLRRLGPENPGAFLNMTDSNTSSQNPPVTPSSQIIHPRTAQQPLAHTVTLPYPPPSRPFIPTPYPPPQFYPSPTPTSPEPFGEQQTMQYYRSPYYPAYIPSPFPYGPYDPYSPYFAHHRYYPQPTGHFQPSIAPGEFYFPPALVPSVWEAEGEFQSEIQSYQAGDRSGQAEEDEERSRQLSTVRDVEVPTTVAAVSAGEDEEQDGTGGREHSRQLSILGDVEVPNVVVTLSTAGDEEEDGGNLVEDFELLAEITGIVVEDYEEGGDFAQRLLDSLPE